MNTALKFRIWDGKQMHQPGCGDYVLTSGNGIAQVLIAHPTHAMGPLLQLAPAQSVTLLLSTGVQDADGREIYHHDILDDPNRLYLSGEVECYDGCFGVVLGYNFDFISFSEMTEEHLKGLRVLGNRFENPDLLP